MTVTPEPKRLSLDQTEFNALSDCDKWRFYRDTSELLQLRTESLEAELAEARFARAESYIQANKTTPIDVAMTFTQTVLEGVIDPFIIKLADAYRRLYREDRSKAVIVERLVGAEQAWDESQAKLKEALAEVERLKAEQTDCPVALEEVPMSVMEAHWAKQRVLELEAENAKLRAAVKEFLDSFPKHYHGFPSKLEWWEIHALRQALHPKGARDEPR